MAPGSKHHLITEGNGIPPAVVVDVVEHQQRADHAGDQRNMQHEQ